MKMKWGSCAILLFGVLQGYNCFGQEGNPATGEEGRIDINMSVGMLFQDGDDISLGFSQAFPESDLLPDNLVGFQGEDYYHGGDGNVSPLVNFLFGIRLKESKSIEHRLRIGVSYSYYWSGNNSYFFEESIPYDTLVSNLSGAAYFVDSVHSEYIELSRRYENVGIDVSYIIRSNPSGRLSFFAGVGLGFGAIVNSKARIEYVKNSRFTFPYVDESQLNAPVYEYAEEQFQLDGGYYGQLYLPIGIDFRLSKFNPFWKRVHIYSELKPGLQYAKQGDEDGTTKTNFGLALFGLRHEF